MELARKIVTFYGINLLKLLVMAIHRKIRGLSDKHKSSWIVVLRAGLGVCLFIKGIQFLQNSALIGQLISGSRISGSVSILQSIIPWVHLLGGLMIITGFLTRLAVLVQLPILTGAIIFVHAKQGVFGGQSDLVFTIIVVIMLLFFLVEGGGSMSMDKAMRFPDRQQKKPAQ